MNRREKILASAVGGLIAVFALGFAVRGFVIKPLKEIDKRIAGSRERLGKIQAERRAYFTAEDRLKDATLRAFADSVDQASAKSGELLTRHILQSGLQEDEFTRLPLGPRKLRGAQEIGWSVQGEGPLPDVVDLLFVLQESPHLHRLDGVMVSQGELPGVVKVRFRYLTLVMDPAPDVQRKELANRYTLESPERHIFNGIVGRDLLRPYLKREPPPPPPGTPGTTPGTTTPPGAAPGPETFRIVSLSEWMGQPEVHVRDLTAQKTVRFKPGEPFAGGTLVCVDYRPLPMPGNSFLRSDSRVIVRIGTEYWAIERGRTLAEKRKLTPEELPAEVAKAK
jgi:hypothetical protein